LCGLLFVNTWKFILKQLVASGSVITSLYYTHFEINGVSCNLIGSQECDFSTNRTAIRAEIALL
jgi:hypothetical protein